MPVIYDNTAKLQEIYDAIEELDDNGVTIPTYQEKTVTPSDASQIIKADSGFDALSKVTVEAISNTFVGSAVPRQAAASITPNNTTQTAVASGKYTTGDVTVAAVPTETKTVDPSTTKQTLTPTSGKYFSQVEVNAMPTATQATPGIDVSSTGLITASATQTAGYVSAGTKSATQQLATKGTTTITPNNTEQTAVASGVYTTGAVKVSAVPTETKSISSNGTYTPSNGKYFSSVTVDVAASTPTYDTPSITVSTGGLITATANGKSNTQQLSTQASATITPSSSSQTAVASGKYTTGAVTVAAVPTEAKTINISENGSTSYTPTSGKFFSSVTVNVDVASSGGGGMNVQGYHGMITVTATSYNASNVKLTVKTTGTYKVSWMGARNTTSGTSGSQLYINNSSYGSATTSFTNSYAQQVTLTGVSLNEGDVVEVRGRARSTSYRMMIGNLIIEQTA